MATHLTHETIYGSGKRPPACPSLVSIIKTMSKEVAKANAEKERIQKNSRRWFRRKDGSGICSKCNNDKPSEEFASPRGYICMECKSTKPPKK